MAEKGFNATSCAVYIHGVSLPACPVYLQRFPLSRSKHLHVYSSSWQVENRHTRDAVSSSTPNSFLHYVCNENYCGFERDQQRFFMVGSSKSLVEVKNLSFQTGSGQSKKMQKMRATNKNMPFLHIYSTPGSGSSLFHRIPTSSNVVRANS